VEQHLVFFHQYLLLLMLLEKERLINYSTVFMYVFDIQFLSFYIYFFFPILPFIRELSLLLNLQDGTLDTIKKSFDIVRDFLDFCHHSYFSYMDDLQQKRPPDVKYYEIRFSISYLLSTSTSCSIHVDTNKTVP
jgi:hypothetical protein